MEICDLPDIEFKIMVINVFIEIRKTMNEQSESFNKKKI